MLNFYHAPLDPREFSAPGVGAVLRDAAYRSF